MKPLLPLNLNAILPSISIWLYAAIRITSFFIATPFFSQTKIPSQAKIFLSLAISFILIPHLIVSKHPVNSLFTSDGILIVLQEIMIGISMGIILQMTFEVLHLAGHYIATAMQLNFAMSFDPSSHRQENIIGNLYFIFGMLLFITLHGPLVLIALLQKSFDFFPISTHLLSLAQIKFIPVYAGHMFSYSLLLALPVMATLLMTNLALSVMTRLAPAMNIFSIGFPVTMIVGLVTIAFSLPFALAHFTDILTTTYHKVISWELMHAHGR